VVEVARLEVELETSAGDRDPLRPCLVGVLVLGVREVPRVGVRLGGEIGGLDLDWHGGTGRIRCGGGGRHEEGDDEAGHDADRDRPGQTGAACAERRSLVHGFPLGGVIEPACDRP
jgi:hypothetical protein